jgi:diamine N-acetyltransferase
MAEPSTAVSLRDVTSENLRAVLKLDVRDDQKHLVASNAVSIAQGHYSEYAWWRAIYANEEPVGFVMLYIDTETPDYGVWRFMIDAAHQGRGYGLQAMKLVVDHVRTLPGATELEISYVPGEGSPQPFYVKCGFVDTGVKREGERVMKMPL